MRIPLWEEENPAQDVWERLSVDPHPILIYGMGNGAEKLTAELAARSIPVSGYFASDGFVRGQSFLGQRVLTREEAFSRYPDATVLLAFASRLPEVLRMLDSMAAEHRLLMPDLPVAGEAFFTRQFLLSHRLEFREAALLFSDDRSRALLDAVLRYKLTGEISYLRGTGCGKEEQFSFLSPGRFRRALDGGAYTGDTAREMLQFAPALTAITAVEPDSRNFRRLCRYTAEEGEGRVIPLHALLSDHIGQETIFASGNRNTAAGNASHQHCTEEVPCVTVDSIAGGIDFIKLDVEGAESKALLGARETILRDRPSLSVSVYHRSEDLFALPLLLRDLCKSYRFCLRREECLPAWEINLLAVPEEAAQERSSFAV